MPNVREPIAIAFVVLCALTSGAAPAGGGNSLFINQGDPAPPPPPDGYQRDFLLRLEGWDKDGDPKIARETRTRWIHETGSGGGEASPRRWRGDPGDGAEEKRVG